MANIINVTVIDSIRAEKRNATIPDDVPLIKLMPELVKKLGYPAKERGDRQMHHTLNFIRNGTREQFAGEKTLAEMGVQEGDNVLINLKFDIKIDYKIDLNIKVY